MHAHISSLSMPKIWYIAISSSVVHKKVSSDQLIPNILRVLPLTLFPESILLAGSKHSTSVPFSARVVVHKKVTLDIHFVSGGRHPDIYTTFIKHGQKSLPDLETNRHLKFSAPTHFREIPQQILQIKKQ